LSALFVIATGRYRADEQGGRVVEFGESVCDSLNVVSEIYVESPVLYHPAYRRWKLSPASRTDDRLEMPSAGDRNGQWINDVAFFRVDITILCDGLDFETDVDSVATAQT
jgi:hypothetical protein